MKREFCFDTNYLDLPSLTVIRCDEVSCSGIHKRIGHVILESMFCIQMIWTKLQADIPNLKENMIHYGSDSFYWTADLQAKSTSSKFTLLSCYRYSCSRKCHSKNAHIHTSYQ